ncbi:MAG: heme ABC exporter ATP-binding protein CcmA [Dehalococcoidia bacterium]|jgi:heme ABC exporter ATP-binding subunit CcmA|uniref:ABC transporter domain-containing protein n=1 Tax=marine metagenome TaxID=408172 RepID=A0A381UU15_9ZZZZ|nr:heme ABC exporter ATP-binding protein CcmA [Dehalococcoidia bacterium]MEC7914544.1 heme ABC exporter ATP-binding protein CcmA [Chloroflexota bacterium]HBE99790.1 heme ABC exporter ATP-binding protein CcmA [Dehalococcoidia bacterium]|tara:strand:- start:143 stop:793 length:651 start_codon:yes stop_codon:yes gene_type:complete
MDALLEVENVTKSYGRNRVLHKLCLSVEPGEVVVIRGINGSGKTTLLSIIASLVSSDYGMVKILGQDLRSNPHRVRSDLAFVAHQPFLYSQLTVKENLEFFGRLNSVDNLDSTILEKAALIGLSNRLGSKIATLSHGYIKRVAIARALLHSPKILLFDEPESGLDQDSLRLFEKIIGDQLESGKSIVMTTHASQISYRGRVRNQRISKGMLVDDIF